jgi:hypothetical protein
MVAFQPGPGGREEISTVVMPDDYAPELGKSRMPHQTAFPRFTAWSQNGWIIARTSPT